jgi:fructose-bisphosphate aldolase, class I
MSVSEIEATAAAMVAPGKGILAADESTGTMDKRLQAAGVEPSEEARRSFRELLFTADGMAEHVSGVIMFDETLRQSTGSGTPFPEYLAARDVLPGIKVDTGAKPLAGAPRETVTEGLDGLRGRLAEYSELGARFAKWRAVIAIEGESLPSRRAIELNAHALARYAALCQEAGVVPIVEPEVLMDGDHPIERSEEVTSRVLHEVFDALFEQGVRLEGIVLKPNMVLSGYSCPEQATVEEVAERTLACLRRVVPAAVPGIAFLSGGQSDELATRHLDAMNRIGGQPWELSFSYGRGLQATALGAWAGEDANVSEAQQIFLQRARCNGAARDGRWSAALEEALVA